MPKYEFQVRYPGDVWRRSYMSDMLARVTSWVGITRLFQRAHAVGVTPEHQVVQVDA